MAKKENIVAKVRSLSLDSPEELRTLALNPYSIEALRKLRDEYTGEWRDKVVGFLDSIHDKYDVEHINTEIDLVLRSRTKLEVFFGNAGRGGVIILGLSFLYWYLFNFWTGVLLFLVLAMIFGLGYNEVNQISTRSFSGDTLLIVEDFKKVINQ